MESGCVASSALPNAYLRGSMIAYSKLPYSYKINLSLVEKKKIKKKSSEREEATRERYI